MAKNIDLLNEFIGVSQEAGNIYSMDDLEFLSSYFREMLSDTEIDIVYCKLWFVDALRVKNQSITARKESLDNIVELYKSGELPIYHSTERTFSYIISFFISLATGDKVNDDIQQIGSDSDIEYDEES